jgi:hypothetical protein
MILKFHRCTRSTLSNWRVQPEESSACGIDAIVDRNVSQIVSMDLTMGRVI